MTGGNDTRQKREVLLLCLIGCVRLFDMPVLIHIQFVDFLTGRASQMRLSFLHVLPWLTGLFRRLSEGHAHLVTQRGSGLVFFQLFGDELHFVDVDVESGREEVHADAAEQFLQHQGAMGLPVTPRDDFQHFSGLRLSRLTALVYEDTGGTKT